MAQIETQSVDGQNEAVVKDSREIFGQATKGCWRMPWHQQAKKDVIPAKSFGELEIASIRRYPNGGTLYE